MLTINPKILIKNASKNEAMWTKYLSPTVFLGYRDGVMSLRRLIGPTLSVAGRVHKKIYLSAAYNLGKLHHIAMSPDALGLPQPKSWEKSFIKIWQRSPEQISEEGEILLSSIAPLLTHLKQVSVNGIFLDANPGNWIIVQGQPVAIDFGHVSRGNFSSDLAQLIDYEPGIVDYQEAINAWGQGIDNATAIKETKEAFHFVRIFSALARAPFHSSSQRAIWYREASIFCRKVGLGDLSDALTNITNEIVEKDVLPIQTC